tara:strand:+ start:1107 stop:1283 length:177 start_codon:yes stop_codon:yes gene_type:complete
MMILGYILVAITIDIKGDVIGTSLNYFYNKQDCLSAANKEKALSPPGYGFVCLEDVVK